MQALHHCSMPEPLHRPGHILSFRHTGLLVFWVVSCTCDHLLVVSPIERVKHHIFSSHLGLIRCLNPSVCMTCPDSL